MSWSRLASASSRWVHARPMALEVGERDVASLARDEDGVDHQDTERVAVGLVVPLQDLERIHGSGRL
jgi:hypothetical protein